MFDAIARGASRSKVEFLRVKRLVAAGQCDQKISQATGIPRRTISGWRRGEGRIRDRSGCDGCGIASHDFSRLPSQPYAYLLGLYLGDGCISRHPRIDVSMYSKHWPCFFPQHGPGRKHLRPIRLIQWQQEIVEVNRKPFIRGLIHSDGTRIIATERKGSYVRRAPRYAFSNNSKDIKRLFCESCDAVGVQWTRPSDRQIAIYRKASVALLDEFVGPKQ